MQKRQWLYIIIVAILIWVICDLALTGVDLLIVTGFTTVLGPAAVGAVTGVVTGIKTSPLWLDWGNWISFAVGGVFIGVLFYYGHSLFNKVRGVAVRSAMNEASYQSKPVITAPTVIKTEPVQVATSPSAPAVEEQATEETPAQ